MSETLSGKTVVVTSTGQDIGRAVARRCLEAGAKVMLAEAGDRDDDTALGDADESAERLAHFAYVAQDRLCNTNLIAATIDRFDRIDVLVNAAQTITAPGAFLDLDTGDFDQAFGDNVRAVFQLSQAVAKRMIADREDGDETPAGAIVNVSSIAAVRTVPQLLTFSVSSAALDQLTRSMAVSLAPHGIRVNAVALGGMMTARLLAAFREDDALREEMVKVTPLGRLAEVEEAAEAVLYLASDRSSYVTGQVLAVDGGRTLLDPLASPVR